MFRTIDFSRFSHGTFAEKVAVSKDLVSELGSKGFVKLCNYGIQPNEIDELFGLARTYFDLEHADKMSGPHPQTPYPHRGYSWLGQEKIAGISGFEKGCLLRNNLTDHKETFDMGSSTDKDFANVWPKESCMPCFRPKMELAFDKQHQCLMQVLESVAIGLGLQQDHFTQFHTRREHEFRLLHYPEVEASALAPGTGKVRIAEHSDFGSLTFLLQDSVGGLYVEDQQHPQVFHHLESSPHEVIVNVGDCLQLWTGRMLSSANHKVTLPEASSGLDPNSCVPERFSIAFFGKPNRDAVVSVVPELESSASLRPVPITAGEYNMQKLMRTY